jgi:phosphotransferase system enzyme I (PtsI)
MGDKMKISGISVSSGIGIGTVRIYRTDLDDIPHYTLTTDYLPDELERYHTAINEVGLLFLHLQQTTSRQFGSKQGEIYEAYQLILEDPFFAEEIPQAIVKEKLNSESLIKEKLKIVEKQFDHIEDPYLKERFFDIKGVGRRLIFHLLQHDYEQQTEFQDEKEASIIVAKELTPADTVHFHHRSLKGIVTEFGGETSHAAILARSLEVPALVGVHDISSIAQNGSKVIVDAEKGEIILNPTVRGIEAYRKRQANLTAKKKKLIESLKQSIKSFPNRDIKLLANLQDISEIKMAKKYNVEGVGLYRTEFNFIAKEDFISEDEQFETYKTLLESFPNQEVTIRILDIGGDKFLPLTQFSHEPNPFLGWRSIRILLDQKDVFYTHIKAILRASVFGNLRIMIPMVASLEDILAVKSFINKVEKELKTQGLLGERKVPLGIMVEVPSAAILIDSFIEHIDFISIGSNDLIQYTLAADRTNDKVSKYYQPCNPAVLKLIEQVGKAGKRHKKPVSICGEMAGDPLFTQLFLALGVERFSMHPSALPLIKTILLHSNEDIIAEVKQNVFAAEQAETINKYLHQQLEKYL